MFAVRIVEALSVSDFLTRYYKRDRMLQVDNAYGKGTMLASYERQYVEDGCITCSHYDNITGEFICWPKYPVWYTALTGDVAYSGADDNRPQTSSQTSLFK